MDFYQSIQNIAFTTWLKKKNMVIVYPQGNIPIQLIHAMLMPDRPLDSWRNFLMYFSFTKISRGILFSFVFAYVRMLFLYSPLANYLCHVPAPSRFTMYRNVNAKEMAFISAPPHTTIYSCTMYMWLPRHTNSWSHKVSHY